MRSLPLPTPYTSTPTNYPLPTLSSTSTFTPHHPPPPPPPPPPPSSPPPSAAAAQPPHHFHPPTDAINVAVQR
ncbi:hypothetical protein M0804_007439 [Polistes exclamans]|nr:hypothetical protein M0804_007439 [Polistes exclamans]